ncbi:hypothetical protein ACIA8G_20280 [Lentzea sp. NPDC051213]
MDSESDPPVARLPEPQCPPARPVLGVDWFVRMPDGGDTGGGTVYLRSAD